MAELLLRVVNRGKGGPDDSLAGDVIWINPDGHRWGTAERTNPQWRIVRVGLTPAECAALLADRPAATLASVYVRRKYAFSFFSLPAEIKNKLLAPRIGDGVIDATKTLAEIRAVCALKA